VQAVVVTRSWRASARSALPHGGEPARGYRRGVPFRISAGCRTSAGVPAVVRSPLATSAPCAVTRGCRCAPWVPR